MKNDSDRRGFRDLPGGGGLFCLAITELMRGLRKYPNLECKFVNK